MFCQGSKIERDKIDNIEYIVNLFGFHFEMQAVNFYKNT